MVDSRDNAGKLDALVGPDLLANIAGFTPTTRAGADQLCGRAQRRRQSVRTAKIAVAIR
jgi:hypothetical protein